MLGIAVTKQQFDEMVGTSARDLKLAYDRARALKAFTDQYTSQNLVDMGLVATTADGDLAKSVVAELVAAADAFTGTFSRRVWGLGVVNTAG